MAHNEKTENKKRGKSMENELDQYFYTDTNGRVTRLQRCCMCPNSDKSSRTCPSPDKPVCNFVCGFSNDGTIYQVVFLPQITRYMITSTASGQTGASSLLKKSFDETQEELNRRAQKMGWSRTDA